MYKDDINFKFIKDKIIKSNIIIGHIRATKYHFKDDICYNNTHPFWYKNNFWIHNGSVSPFNSHFYNNYIDNKYKLHIKGKTDSEVLFYIYMTIFDKLNDEEKSWIEFIHLIDMFYSKYQITISANIVFSNEISEADGCKKTIILKKISEVIIEILNIIMLSTLFF